MGVCTEYAHMYMPGSKEWQQEAGSNECLQDTGSWTRCLCLCVRAHACARVKVIVLSLKKSLLKSGGEFHESSSGQSQTCIFP